MKHARVVLEFSETDGLPVMRWERIGSTEAGGTYELLGRAFEMALREDPTRLNQALEAFLRGAMLSKQDVTEAL